ncbi:hypothetical protein ACEQ8H_006631 [Pleosporales sp. CAS-2024a]
MSGHVSNRGINTCAYNASKAAVHQLTRSLAAEWGHAQNTFPGSTVSETNPNPSNEPRLAHLPIRVNTLSPGHIDTPLSEAARKRGLTEEWAKQNMLGRISQVEEYRAPILFLLADGSSYMTGADLRVDDAEPNTTIPVVVEAHEQRGEVVGAPGSFAVPQPQTAFWDDDVASAADWDTYTLKGGALMCAMAASDGTAGLLIKDRRNPPSAASVWAGSLRQELSTWYWREMSPSSKGCHLDAYWEISATLKALGLNGKPASAGGDNVCSRIEHWDAEREENGKLVPAINQWYKVDGIDYRATKAHYEFIMNRKGGAIYGTYLDGPKSSASREWYGNKKEPTTDLLPQLRSLSDVLWGYWARENPNVKNIRYFFMLGIANELTNQLIASCLQNAKKTLTEWPGLSFDTSTDEGHALLASPNGAVFAYFLLQHKAQLGPKTITRVTIIRPENDAYVDWVDASLVFHVADAADPGPGAHQDGGVIGNDKRHDGSAQKDDYLDKAFNAGAKKFGGAQGRKIAGNKALSEKITNHALTGKKVNPKISN